MGYLECALRHLRGHLLRPLLLAHVPTVCLPTLQHFVIFQSQVDIEKVGFRFRHLSEQFLPTLA